MNVPQKAFDRSRMAVILLIGAVSGYLILDLLVFDKWSVGGRVFDSATGAPVRRALVLVSVVGDSLRFPWPHSAHRNEICIQSFTSATDDNGEFSASRLGRNRLMLNKRVIVSAFAPGWYQRATVSQPASSALLGGGSHAEVPMTKDKGEVWSILRPENQQRPADPSGVLSRSLTEISKQLGSGRVCGAEALDYMVTVLDYAVKHARTDEERRFVVRQCSAFASSAASLAVSPGRSAQASLEAMTRAFPYGCDRERLFEYQNASPSNSLNEPEAALRD